MTNFKTIVVAVAVSGILVTSFASVVEKMSYVARLCRASRICRNDFGPSSRSTVDGATVTVCVQTLDELFGASPRGLTEKARRPRC